MEEISKIILQWEAEQIRLNPPATLHTIKKTEQLINYIFPTDFKELYLVADGFKDWDWRPNMFSLWPLQRIIDEYFEQMSTNRDTSSYQNNSTKNFVGFCDFLINSHQIGFLKNKPGIHKSYDETNPIAQSFNDALDLINRDSQLIY